MRLYHYTTIETLALILANQTIRFTRLDQLDDLNEVGIYKTKITQYFFVSCWTLSSQESIAQWSMYGGNGRGVIVSLDTDFIQFPNPFIVASDNKHVVSNDVSRGVPFKVHYFERSELEKRAREIENINDVGGVSAYGQLGNIKSEDWDFQKEYRHCIMITKYFEMSKSEARDNIMTSTIPDLIYFDLNLKEGFLGNIHVILGPHCEDNDRIVVEGLLRSHGIMTPLIRSRCTDGWKKK